MPFFGGNSGGTILGNSGGTILGNSGGTVLGNSGGTILDIITSALLYVLSTLLNSSSSSATLLVNLTLDIVNQGSHCRPLDFATV